MEPPTLVAGLLVSLASIDHKYFTVFSDIKLKVEAKLSWSHQAGGVFVPHYLIMSLNHVE